MSLSPEKQPFEHHPALASWIERLAHSQTGLSLGEWMIFVGALNQAFLDAARSDTCLGVGKQEDSSAGSDPSPASRSQEQHSAGLEPVAWLCVDLILNSKSIIDDAKHAAARAHRTAEWSVQPLYTLPAPSEAPGGGGGKPPSEFLVIHIPHAEAGEITVDAYADAGSAQDALLRDSATGWYGDVLSIYRHGLKSGEMGKWWGGMWLGYGRRRGLAPPADEPLSGAQRSELSRSAQDEPSSNPAPHQGGQTEEGKSHG